MGNPFTAEAARYIWQQLPIIFAATMSTLFISLLVGYILHKQCRIDIISSTLGSVPGGLSQMLILSKEIRGADTNIVILMQTVRLVGVLFIVPFVAMHGLADVVDPAARSAANISTASFSETISVIIAVAFFTLTAVKLRFPTPWLMGPTLGVAAMICSGYPPLIMPNWLVIIAQISFGAYMGTTLNVDRILEQKKLFWYNIIGSAVVLGWVFAMSALLNRLADYSIATAFLGLAPGGIAEMGITAMVVHADIPAVIAYQMFRLMFILLVIPPMLKSIFAKIN